jgi:uncharacterized protein YecE (DUF72 family)
VDFGRLASLEGVSFALPELDPRSDAILGGRAEASVVRIGAPAWASRDFAKKVYPKGTKAGDNLARYAERFATVELNATFHRVPDVRTIEGWRDATPEGFRFCPKMPKATCEDLDPDRARRFADLVAHLGSRLGPVWLQPSPAFSPKRLPELERFLAALEGRAVAVELRHRGWFQTGRLIDEAFQLFARHGATAIITDTAGRRDASHASLTSRTAMVRFAGNELHESDAQRLDAWASRFAAWLERGVTSIYCFVHQPDDTLAPEALALLAESIRERCGLDVAPRPS